MRTALLFLLIHGCVGACDTLFYYEYRLRLPYDPVAQSELRLHAGRDLAAAVISGSLAWLTWNRLWTWVLMALLLGVVGIMPTALTLLFLFLNTKRAHRVVNTLCEKRDDRLLWFSLQNQLFVPLMCGPLLALHR